MGYMDYMVHMVVDMGYKDCRDCKGQNTTEDKVEDKVEDKAGDKAGDKDYMDYVNYMNYMVFARYKICIYRDCIGVA